MLRRESSHKLPACEYMHTNAEQYQFNSLFHVNLWLPIEFLPLSVPCYTLYWKWFENIVHLHIWIVRPCGRVG